MVRLRFAALAAFLRLRLVAARCFVVAMCLLLEFARQPCRALLATFSSAGLRTGGWRISCAGVGRRASSSAQRMCLSAVGATMDSLDDANVVHTLALRWLGLAIVHDAGREV